MAAGALALAPTMAEAGEIEAFAIPTRDFVAAFAAKFNVKAKVCGESNVTGMFAVNSAEDLANALINSGRAFEVAADGTWLIDCDAANKLRSDPLGQYVSGPLSQAALGANGNNIQSGSPLGPQYRYDDGQGYAQSVPVEPATYRMVETRYQPKKKFDLLETLGLKVLGDPDIPGPLLLVGPAKIVDEAESYIRAVDICPRQLRVEATVITRANRQVRNREFGVRIGSAKAHLGTAGVSDNTGIDLPLLTAFLEANRGVFEAGTNATFRGRVVEGDELKLADGQDVPVRAATSVTDRETRQDVIYRTAGHQLAVRPLALSDGEAVLMVDHSISALVANGELGPQFATRSTSANFRVAYGEPVILSLSGSDTANRAKSRGILSRADAIEAADAGAFLLLAVQLDRCRAAAGEDVQPQAARQRSAGEGG